MITKLSFYKNINVRSVSRYWLFRNINDIKSMSPLTQMLSRYLQNYLPKILANKTSANICT